VYILEKFSMTDMTSCGQTLRRLGQDVETMEEVADLAVDYLYRNLLIEKNGSPAAALVRVFKTHPYGALDAGQQTFAASIIPENELDEHTKCLTLLATAGEIPEWNDRKLSHGHVAIPLPSEELIRSFPMISNLVKQFGVEPRMIVRPDPTCLQNLDEITYNVFLVQNAVGSDYIPAQEEFVVPYGIVSVLGFGGILPSGDLFATILFLKVNISESVAELFKPLALSMKLALLPHDGARVFT